jgi:hypothetical protein
MKTKRFQEYLDYKRQNKGINQKEGVAKHSDNKIDEDFKGYPHGQAKEKLIKPETGTEKKTAAVDVKDGEKMNNTRGRSKQKDEQDSDGSGGAFAGTEDVKE